MAWWPFAVVLQGEAANHREVRRGCRHLTYIRE